MEYVNPEYNYSEPENDKWGLTTPQIIAIFIAAGLFCWGLFEVFKSSSVKSVPSEVSRTGGKMAASEIANLLNT